ALPVLAAGAANVVAGAAGLGAPVRWVHVVESRDVAELLDGGELLLATGVGWPEGTGWMAGYIAELAAVQVAGLVLELGTRYLQPPPDLVERCEAHRLPLVVLHKRVKFVSVTESVHGRIISEQMAALRARDEVHALFSELSLRGSPADYIVAQLGAVLGCPVVLEDMAHQVVAFEAAGLSEDVLLGGWEVRSRAAHRARTEDAGEDSRTAVLGTEGWLVTPVEARGTRWGFLIAFDGAPHPAGRALVLEQAAVALSLSRLADGTAENWTPASQHWLLASLLQGRYRSDAALRARFEAMGLPVTNRRLCGLAVRAAGGTARDSHRWPGVAEIARLARSMGANAVASVVESAGEPLLLVAVSVAARGPGRAEPEAAVDAFAARLHGLLADWGPDSVATMSAGGVVEQIGSLAASLQEALEIQDSLPHTASTVLHRKAGYGLRRLVGQLRSDPRVQAFLERSLGTLLEYDDRHGTDLLPVLRAYLAHPGNRTLAAANSHLSRSVFYQRLDTIGGLLVVDLADGEVIAGLHTAVMAWEASRGFQAR
ncbi:MAG: PucR family transcriptional regulator, partial [Specibacter sp.]